MDAEEQNIIDLEPGSEWRFELEADENAAVRVSERARPAAALGGAASKRQRVDAVCSSPCPVDYLEQRRSLSLPQLSQSLGSCMYTARCWPSRLPRPSLTPTDMSDGRYTPPTRCTSTARSCRQRHGIRCIGIARGRFTRLPLRELRVSGCERSEGYHSGYWRVCGHRAVSSLLEKSPRGQFRRQLDDPRVRI